MERAGELSLRVLFKRASQMWVAQCLEHDLAAQGPSLETARIAFERTLAAQVQLDLSRGLAPLAGIPPAPQEYFQIFAEAEFQVQPLQEQGSLPPSYQIAALREFRLSEG